MQDDTPASGNRLQQAAAGSRPYLCRQWLAMTGGGDGYYGRSRQDITAADDWPAVGPAAVIAMTSLSGAGDPGYSDSSIRLSSEAECNEAMKERSPYDDDDDDDELTNLFIPSTSRDNTDGSVLGHVAGHDLAPTKRRVNDVTSQCIQAHCRGKDLVERIKCIVQHC